jgi:hypothetical protein
MGFLFRPSSMSCTPLDNYSPLLHNSAGMEAPVGEALLAYL